MSRAVDGPKVPSGAKYTSPEGHVAVRNGQKAGRAGDAPIERKPDWLRVRIPSGGRFGQVREIVREHRLATVCEESHCPNMGECWNNGTATIMVMGSICTRACRFCAVDTGNPQGWLDAGEPAAVADSVELMGLRYVVLTSVDRDDLADGGAGHYAACVRAIKARTPQVAVEALTPDFQGRRADVETVVDSGLEVFAQNLETVERLTHVVRDPRAGYQQTLDVLAHAKAHRPEVLTKTSLIAGVGETDDEILEAMDDLRAHDVDLLTIGQYLRPTKHHLPVARWVEPERFEAWREAGLERGFREVASGALVRSSYRADRILDGDNLGLATDAAATGRIPLRQL